MKDFDFELKANPVHETFELEQINILNELIDKIQESSSNSLSQVVVSESQENSIGNLFSWTHLLKILVIVVIGFILLVVSIQLFIAFNPVSGIENSIRRRNQLEINRSMPQEMLRPMLSPSFPHHAKRYPSILHANAPTTEMTHMGHSHNNPSYVVGRGLNWEDVCPCTHE